MENPLEREIQYCKGVGPKRALLYNKLGIFTLEDLLRHYPRSYIDFSSIRPIFSVPLGETAAVQGTVYKKLGPQRIRKGMEVYKVTVGDDSGALDITFFNTPYPFRALKEGETYRFFGKMEGTLLRRSMNSPKFITAGDPTVLSPIYSQTAGLSSKVIASAVAWVLKSFGDAIPDPLPCALLQKHDFPPLSQALSDIHFPRDAQTLSRCRNRLIYEELLTLRLAMVGLKNRNSSSTKVIPPKDLSLTPFFSALPFSLTAPQQHAIDDAIKDICSGVPMNRLVQGDVGSGKTMVAAALCFIAAKNGLQSVIMAPTEILARQHFSSFSQIFAPLGITCGVLCGSTPKKEKEEIKEALRNGEIQVLIGTHAVIQPDVIFSDLFLTVTDEQHRFGVAQRGLLHQKGRSVHHLVMSATPIPRTLSLMIYGDLDISVIDALPPGRRPVETHFIPQRKRKDMYDFLLSKIRLGQQVYIVCPMIDSEDEEDLSAAVHYIEQLKTTSLRNCSMELIHGKMRAKEKEKIMDRFSAGDLHILVSTTVIEVGVNVPNATVMVIEEANHFGLSQLHQLRGRVGRGETQSYCFLLASHPSPQAKERLQFLSRCNDGFAVAEYDLAQRGPGNFFGNAQHGLPDLKIASYLTDAHWIRCASNDAECVLSQDPSLSLPHHLPLRQMVDNLLRCVGNSLN